MSTSFSAMQWTREQLLAQTTDRHISIVAGAGAGKTTVLVERYIRLLLYAGADTRSIVAITFTRKAAGEMHHRIVERLNAMLEDERYRDQWHIIKGHSERMTGAMITTIHGFCGRILRDFPIEADVNPTFKEIEEYDAVRLKDRAIRKALDEHLTTDDESRRKVLDLVQLLSRRGLHTALLQLLQSGETFEQLTQLYQRSDDEILTHQTAEFFAHLKRINEYGLHLYYCTSLIDEAGVLTPKQDQALSTLRHHALLLAKPFVLSPQSPSYALELVKAIEYAHKILQILRNENITTATGKLNSRTIPKKLFNNDLPAYNHQQGELEECWTTVEAMFTAFLYRDKDRTMLASARSLFALATTAHEYYTAAKDRGGWLDFDDLLLKTRAVLAMDAVQTALRIKYQYVMIDEFQDTNDVQYDIAVRLVDVYSTTQNLYIVGDPKQSIYRFRGADVSVFAKARTALRERNEERRTNEYLGTNTYLAPIEEAQTEQEHCGELSLAATFRLAPVVAAFVNHVCGVHMRHSIEDTTSRHEVAYTRIICGADTNSETRGSVQLLYAQPDNAGKPLHPEDTQSPSLSEQADQTSLDDDSQDTDPTALNVLDDSDKDSDHEALLVAEYLHHVVEQKTLRIREKPIRNTDESTSYPTRPPRYSDVMILLRSRTGTDKLLTALRKKNIPFYVSGGTGFYSQPEIQDIITCLEFLHNPSDNIACVALLRSPFFEICHEELHRLALWKIQTQTNKQTSTEKQVYFWRKVSSYINHADTVPHKPTAELRYAFDTLSDLLLLAQHISIPLLLHTILDRTQWRSHIAGMEREEQMLANMDKFMNQARDFEKEGFLNLHDFVTEVRILQAVAEKESEQNIVGERDAVQIMTIHASKGLEAPIVLLYAMNKGTRQETGVRVNAKEYGIFFPMTDDDGETIKTPIYLAGVSYERQAEKAELKRLLYVAMTRAKDHLILSACPSSKSGITAGSMLSLVYSGLLPNNPFDVTPFSFRHEWEEIVQKEIKTLLEKYGFSTLLDPIDFPIEQVERMYNELYDRLQKMYAEMLTYHAVNIKTDLMIRFYNKVEMMDTSVIELEQENSMMYIYRTPQQVTALHNVTTTPEPVQTTIHDPLPLYSSLYQDPALLGFSMTVSASQMLKFQHTPTVWYEEMILGLSERYMSILYASDNDSLPTPLASSEIFSVRNNENTALSSEHTLTALPEYTTLSDTEGSAPGTVFHAVMERLPLWLGDDGTVHETTIEDHIKTALHIIPKQNQSAVYDRIYKEVLNVAQHEFVQSLQKPLREARYEVPFLCHVGDDYIEGYMDCLVETTPGIIEVWDWKTNTIDASHSADTWYHHYTIQLQVYVVALATMYPHQKHYTARLLFTRLADQSTSEEWTRTLTVSDQDIVALRHQLSAIIQRMKHTAVTGTV